MTVHSRKQEQLDIGLTNILLKGSYPQEQMDMRKVGVMLKILYRTRYHIHYITLCTMAFYSTFSDWIDQGIAALSVQSMR